MTFKEWLKPSKGVKRLMLIIATSTSAFLLWGCSSLWLIPTHVNPIADMVIEGETPNYKQWTFQGLEDARVDYLVMMYPIVIETHEAQRKVSEGISTTILGIVAATGMAGTGALPIVAKMVPKGAIKKEEHEKLVAEAELREPQTA